MAELLIAFQDLHSGQYNKLVVEYENDEISITLENEFYTYTNSKYILVELTSYEILKFMVDLCLLPEWKSILLLNEKDL